MYYLSTDTVKKAYDILVQTELKDPSMVFSFIIMRGCGINKTSYESPSFKASNGLYYASRISSLFSPEEDQPKKYGFINPFQMSEWDPQAPSEPLSKWIGGRLKNNVLGGAMTWRNLIDIDTKTEDKKIKFKYDYISELKKMAFDVSTINLLAFAVWSNRFCELTQKLTPKEICQEFIISYKLDPEEVSAFFNTSNTFDLEYSDHIYDAKEIRDLIGQPKDNAWHSGEFSVDYFDDYVLSKYEFNVRPSGYHDVSIDLICSILDDYHQVVLEGPPGTSKSYYASEISKKYDKVVHVQFHPKYTYQNFVGGYVVDKSDVVYRQGVLLDLILDKSFSDKKKYLIIIDEFNRANVSQVLGETIQCLDRNQSVQISVDSEMKDISIPSNVHIIATLNTSDRTLGTVDHAIKRRFMEIPCYPNPTLLIDLCPAVNFVSLCDFLTKVNNNLVRATNNKELQIGHAVFLNDSVKTSDKYIWTFESFRVLYNYKILPMIEDYCSNNHELVEDVVGYSLATRLDQESFEASLKEFLEL